MNIKFKRHTPEDALFVVRASAHYFDDAEKDGLNRLGSWIKEYVRQYPNRHTDERAARATACLKNKLAPQLFLLDQKIKITPSADKRLIYAFLHSAIQVALEERYYA